MYRTKVGVDLAKNIIQVCTLNGKSYVQCRDEC